MSIISKFLKNVTNGSVDFSQKKLNETQLLELFKALGKRDNIQVVNLEHNSIGGYEAAFQLSQMLIESRSIIKLYLGHNLLANNVDTLAAGFVRYNKLRLVDLRDNNISDKGVIGIALALNENNALKNLSLRSNAISDEGAKYLANSLKTNQSLEHLDLTYNQIDDEGACDLADAIENNKVIKSINLEFNRFDKDGSRALARALLHNKSLEKFIANSSCDDDTTALFLKAAIQNPKLRVLCLGNKAFVKEPVVLAFIRDLENNTSLTELTFSRMHLHEEYDSKIDGILERNRIIADIEFLLANLNDIGNIIRAQAQLGKLHDICEKNDYPSNHPVVIKKNKLLQSYHDETSLGKAKELLLEIAVARRHYSLFDGGAEATSPSVGTDKVTRMEL